jgi:serine/threonine-protein kinase
MSPEQCLGIPEGTDHRADIYSFGIILYEMLCGSPPFVSQGVGEIMLMHVSRVPDPPSARCPDVPAWMEKVILCALEKKPEHRFPTMAALVSALGGLPVATLVVPAAGGPSMAILGQSASPGATRPLSQQMLTGDARSGLGPAGGTTLSPHVTNPYSVTLVTAHRRGVILGGAIVAAGLLLLLAYLLLGRSGNDKPTVRALPDEASRPSRMPATPPPSPAPEPPPTVEPRPSPAANQVEALLPAAKTPTPPDSYPASSRGNRPGRSTTTRAPAAGKRSGGGRAAARSAPAEPDEKW